MYNEPDLKICLVGATGRMGQEVIGLVGELRDEQSSAEAGSGSTEVVAGIVDGAQSVVGHMLEGVRESVASQWKSEFEDSNVIIDFSSPEGATLALELAIEHSIPILVCSTGLDDSHEGLIERAAEKIPVIRASNTSIGVNLMLSLVQEAAAVLGTEFDIEILETHHRFKRDAPSGTALALAEAVVAGRSDISLADNLVTGRFGITGTRSPSDIAVLSQRGGDVAGEHTVSFFGHGERLELVHRATDRRIFADGALRAARWLVKHQLLGKAGRFTMLDVLRN